jgi:hypothetical protein
MVTAQQDAYQLHKTFFSFSLFPKPLYDFTFSSAVLELITCPNLSFDRLGHFLIRQKLF